MHAVTLIARAIPEAERLPVADTQTETCCLTGQVCECVPRKMVITRSFTNCDILAAPGSDWISADAYQALRYKWERMSSWICDGVAFTRLDRQGVRKAVFAARPARLWAAYATTSYKKHGALFAPVNAGKRRVWRFENLTVDLTGEAHHDLFAALCRWQLRGLSRRAMETCDPSQFDLKAVGIKGWSEFARWAMPLHQGNVYQFMCYLLPSQAELKEAQECDTNKT